jgi:hypothetical protein
MHSAVGVLLHDGKRIKNRPMGFVVGVELKGVEQPDEHCPVALPVGTLHDGVELLAVGRPGRLELAYEIAQRLFVCDWVPKRCIPFSCETGVA